MSRDPYSWDVSRPWDASQPHPFVDWERSRFSRPFGIHGDTSRRPHEHATPLVDVPLPKEPEVPKKQTVVEPARLQVLLATDDEQPIANAKLLVEGGTRFSQTFTTDDAGMLDAQVPEDGVYDLTFDPFPIELPAGEEEMTFQSPRFLPRNCKSFEAGTGKQRTIVVVRSRVTEVVFDGYASGAAVMRWGGMRARLDATVGTARGALRVALGLGRGQTMCVAGHADPEGADGENQALAAVRAVSLHLFASGDLDGWAEHAAGNAGSNDLACALVAANRILGEAPIAIDDKKKLDAALAAVRLNAGLASEGQPGGVEDWRAIADLYDFDLACFMHTDREYLASLRQTITWTDPPTLSLGEQFPVPSHEVINPTTGGVYPNLMHRRCGLLIFSGQYGTPELAVASEGKEVYDGTYNRTTIHAPGEVLVDIEVDTMKRESIGRGRAWVGCGELGVVEMTAAADGHIRFFTLKGDVVSVVAAFDADGNGTLVNGGVNGTA